jgi:glutamine---fructose-6-phosphate transaminase (isomerizing)
MTSGKSVMQETMERQPADLAALLDDWAPVEAATRRLEGRRVALVGTGTSWHAASHGAWMLWDAGVDARALPSMDAALYPDALGPEDAIVLLSHSHTKRYTLEVFRRARSERRPCVVVAARGTEEADIETVPRERSSAFTASHLAALLRLAQLAQSLGADLGSLELLPEAVERALAELGHGVEPPARLLELVGAGPNQWTAAEGALKVREASWVATEGLPVEQFLHGPAVALDERDTLVVLDGGGPAAERLGQTAAAGEQAGATVHRLSAPELGEQLSIFPLTVAVQRVALELALALGTNPDNFRRDVHDAWSSVGL